MRTARLVLFCLVISVGVPLAQNNLSPQLHKADLPIYPPLARQARIAGIVKISFELAEDGTVSDVQAMSGHPMLKPAAVENVRSWKFNSVNSKQHLETEFVFRLGKKVEENPRLTVSLESFRQIEVISDVVISTDSVLYHR
jgi:TonB family protein